MNIDSCSVLSGIDEALWLRLVDIVRDELADYNRRAKIKFYQDPTDLVLETLAWCSQVPDSPIFGMSHNKICFYLRHVIRLRLRDSYHQERLSDSPQEHFSDSPLLVIALSSDLSTQQFLLPLKHAVRSLGVRLITCAKDRCMSVKAKIIFGKLACQSLGLAKAGEQIASYPGI